MNAIVSATPGAMATLGSGPSILGAEPVRHIETTGKIRPGLKVLTAKGARNPKAVEIWRRAWERYPSGELPDWKVVEQAIEKNAGERGVLRPANVGLFVVRAADFDNPADARTLLERYGEERTITIPGLGEVRQFGLYRFPVVLPFSSWLACLPHGFGRWSASERLNWSEYKDGQRLCASYRAVPRPERGRPVRLWGGRPVEHLGACDPNACRHYQGGDCKLKGELIFWVPGINGALSLPTTSYYSMRQWRNQMALVDHVRGRIDGLEGGRPVFYLCRSFDEIARIDPDTGQSKREHQWLTHLGVDLDMVAALEAAHAAQAALPPPAHAAALAPPAVDEEDMDNIAAEDSEDGGESHQDDDPRKVMLAKIGDGLERHDINGATFRAYCGRCHGPQWAGSIDALTDIHALIEQLDEAAADEEAGADYEQMLDLILSSEEGSE